MKRYHRAALASLSIVLLAGCEELAFQPVPEATPQSIFEQTWTFADEEYSFFDFKGVDWDAAREEYEPLVTADMTDGELFDILADMLFELRDGHVNLVSPFDVSRNWQWYLDYEPNYDYSVLERNYFTDADGRSVQQLVGSFITMDFPHPDGDVGYIHYRSFSNPVLPEDLDYIFTIFADAKGLIIDVRDNGGGSISNVFAIGNRFTDETVAGAQERLKNGPGRDDYTQPRTISLSPVPEQTVWTRPVVILTNRGSYSATNYFATVMGELDHVTVMGDWTGGGGGVPANTQLTNGWYLRVSTGQLFRMDESGTLTLDERNVEDGIAPDIAVTTTEAELATGVDGILEAALAYIRDLP